MVAGIVFALTLIPILLAAQATVVDVSWGFDVSGASVTIDTGDTVRWQFDQGFGVRSTAHNVVSGAGRRPDGRFASAFLDRGSWAHTFEAPGVFEYFCTPHRSMVGTITVIDSGTTSSAASTAATSAATTPSPAATTPRGGGGSEDRELEPAGCSDPLTAVLHVDGARWSNPRGPGATTTPCDIHTCSDGRITTVHTACLAAVCASPAAVPDHVCCPVCPGQRGASQDQDQEQQPVGTLTAVAIAISAALVVVVGIAIVAGRRKRDRIMATMDGFGRPPPGSPLSQQPQHQRQHQPGVSTL